MASLKRVGIYVLSIAATLALAQFLLMFGIATDRAYVCEYTASRYGYRTWFWGSRTGDWHDTSPLESYIARNAPGTIRHKWTSYNGTGKNIFGMSVSFGHGQPGGALFLSRDVLSVWMSDHSKSEILGLYSFLQKANREASNQRCMAISEQVKGGLR